MNVVIFGCSGQDGYYLAKVLISNSYNVVGVSRSEGDWLQGDVSNFVVVSEVIKKYQPALIFHFAANSTTAHFSIFENHESISTGTINILESVRLYSPHSKVFLSGSAVQFQNTGKPIDEKTPFASSSSYAVARIHATYAGRYFRETFGLKVYTGFLFNHDSPFRTERHVNQKIAATARRIANGCVEKLVLGNPFVEKEFNYAADIVDAMWILVNQDAVFEAVLGNGKAHTVFEWAEYCFKKVGLVLQDHLQIEENFIPEYMRLVSNPHRIMSLGWRSKTSFEQLADMMLNSPTQLLLK